MEVVLHSLQAVQEYNFAFKYSVNCASKFLMQESQPYEPIYREQNSKAIFGLDSTVLTLEQNSKAIFGLDSTVLILATSLD